MTQTKTPLSKNHMAVLLGIGLVLIVLFCFGCILTSVLQTAGFFAAAVLHATSTPFSVSSANANQILAVQQEQNGKIVLNGPEGVSLDEQGNIYVGNNADGTISVFDPSGTLVRSLQWVDKQVNDTHLNGMAVAPDGTVYVSYQGDIHRLNPDGSQTTLPYDRNATLTSYLEGIVMLKDGSLLASDDSGNILHFATDETVNVVVKAPFDAYLDHSNSELTLAADDDGTIYALGGISWQIIKLAPDGSFIGQFGGDTHNHVSNSPDEPVGVAVPGLDPGFFFFPSALAIDHHGNIYIADGTGYVQVFDTNLTYLRSFMVPDDISSMTFDPSGDLFVTTDTPQLLKIAVQP